MKTTASMPDPGDFVYRITLFRKEPRYYQSRRQVKIVSYRSLRAFVKAWKGRSQVQIVKIERIPAVEWEEMSLEQQAQALQGVD